MKETRELIEFYLKRKEMYMNMSYKATKEEDKAYYAGIAEGFEKAAEELSKVNEVISNKIKNLL